MNPLGANVKCPRCGEVTPLRPGESTAVILTVDQGGNVRVSCHHPFDHDKPKERVF